ncbi:putative MFS family arabinose efflux permease [Frondihabitans sp. PhB188]|uniref:MFS transporter n=1 Tax=Frondihabitans sp. PhB188 TaxID=2485200 RepID=UPI000F4624CA|nr:MFS transporter [Frondihabitans sp. PhB188]ROQ36584.1 putative MFS family arabinose efflux permease [Frondihabitans sp. PhB188]
MTNRSARLAPASTTTSWRNAVMVLFALGGIALSTWGPRLPSIRDSLGIGDGLIGIALAGVTVGSVTGLSLAAHALARFGPRRAIGGAAVLIGVGIALVGLGAGVAASVPATVVGFVVVGLAVGSFDVLINVQGAAVETAAGRTLMPLLHAAWSAGAVIGSGIGAGAAALGVGFAWQFLAEAALIAVVGLGATAYLRLPPAEEGEAAEVGGADGVPWRVRLGQSARRLLDPRLLLIGVVMLGAELGEGTANSWLSLSARDGHGQTETVAALFFTVFAISETAARVAGGPVVDRIGRVRTIRLTTAIGVVGLAVFILGGPVWVVLVGVVLWGFGVSMGFPLGMSAAAESGPNAAARVSAVASVGYLANLAGPPVIGGLSEAIGLLDSFWLVAVLLAVAFAAAGSLRSRR